MARKTGTFGTSDRFRDDAGRIWKLTKKGWRVLKAKRIRRSTGKED